MVEAPIRLLIPLLALILRASPVAAQESGSSLQAWVEELAAALQDRMPPGSQPLRLEVIGDHGVDERKARRVFGRHLRRALDARSVAAGADGAPTLRVALSIQGGHIWAVAELPDTAAGPAQVVTAAAALDRELEAVLGARVARPGQGRWRFERLGLEDGGVLDVALVDLDGDSRDEILLLGLDAVRALTLDPVDDHPQPIGGPWPLPRAGRWPRSPAGWLAADRHGLRIGSNAGHGARLDPQRGTWSAVAPAAPLAQPPGVDGPLLLQVLNDGPSLAAPPDVGAETLRDLRRIPGGGSLLVDGAGRLRAHGVTLPERLDGRAVGDRLALRDLDDDGTLELAFTEPTPPGDPDTLWLVRLDGDGPVLFRADLDGLVSALVVGDLDFDGLLDLVVVGELSDGVMLWRLEAER